MPACRHGYPVPQPPALSLWPTRPRQAVSGWTHPYLLRRSGAATSAEVAEAELCRSNNILHSHVPLQPHPSPTCISWPQYWMNCARLQRPHRPPCKSSVHNYKDKRTRGTIPVNEKEVRACDATVHDWYQYDSRHAIIAACHRCDGPELRDFQGIQETAIGVCVCLGVSPPHSLPASDCIVDRTSRQDGNGVYSRGERRGGRGFRPSCAWRTSAAARTRGSRCPRARRSQCQSPRTGRSSSPPCSR